MQGSLVNIRKLEAGGRGLMNIRFCEAGVPSNYMNAGGRYSLLRVGIISWIICTVCYLSIPPQLCSSRTSTSCAEGGRPGRVIPKI